MQLSLGNWAFNREIRAGRLSQIDYVRLTSKRYNLNACELLSTFFPTRDSTYLHELRTVAEGEGVKLSQMPVDSTRIALSDQAQLRQELDDAKHWIEVADQLGIPTVRIASGPFDVNDAKAFETLIASYRELSTTAAGYGIALAVENLGPLTNNADGIVRIVQEVAASNLGTCLDWGNTEGALRYTLLEQIAPFAKMVHAKVSEPGSDPEKQIDAERCMQIVRDSGYDGYIALESSGSGDTYTGVADGLAVLRGLLEGQPVQV